MFEEFMGIPAHPLLLHAAVVFVPLLALLTVGYALVPPIRPHTRWVLGLLAVGAPVAALLSKLSGDAFLERMRAANRVTPEFLPKLEAHQEYGDITLYVRSGSRSWHWHWSGSSRRVPPQGMRAPVGR